MAYASTADMVAEFGEPEMIRLSAPEGGLEDAVVVEAVERALEDASATIDGYLRTRYALPMPLPAPAEIARAARVLARYDLARGGQKSPSESMAADRKEVMAWLGEIAAGRVKLALAEQATGAADGEARVSDRPTMFTSGGGLGW